MATLEQMFPDFLNLSIDDRGAFFDAYHLRRTEDLLSENRFAKKQSRKGAGDTLQKKLSPEELAMMKKFGLRMKDITSLVVAMEGEDEEETISEEENLEED